MMTLCKFFSVNQQPDIDPYQIGSLIGPRAFTAGDWVVIIPSSNRPAKVRCRELTGAIRVILGNGNRPREVRQGSCFPKYH